MLLSDIWLLMMSLCFSRDCSLLFDDICITFHDISILYGDFSCLYIMWWYLNAWMVLYVYSLMYHWAASNNPVAIIACLLAVVTVDIGYTGFCFASQILLLFWCLLSPFDILCVCVFVCLFSPRPDWMKLNKHNTNAFSLVYMLGKQWLILTS